MILDALVAATEENWPDIKAKLLEDYGPREIVDAWEALEMEAWRSGTAPKEDLVSETKPTDDQRRRAGEMAKALFPYHKGGAELDEMEADIAYWLARLEADKAELKQLRAEAEPLKAEVGRCMSSLQDAGDHLAHRFDMIERLRAEIKDAKAEVVKLKNGRRSLRDLAKYCGCVHSDLENLDDEEYWQSRRIQDAFDRRDKRLLELKRMLDHRDDEIERLKAEIASAHREMKRTLDAICGAGRLSTFELLATVQDGIYRAFPTEAAGAKAAKPAKGSYLDTLTPEIRDAAWTVTCRMAGSLVCDVWENEEAQHRDAAALAAKWRWLHPDSKLEDWGAAEAWVRAFPDVIYAD